MIAAIAVSAGTAPLLFFAFENRLLQPLELAPVELTQTARISARVLIVVTGTVPLPAGVVAKGTPVAWFVMLRAPLKAFAMPVVDSEWPVTAVGAPMCRGSVAKPASAKAVTAVVISLIDTKVTLGKAALAVALELSPEQALRFAIEPLSLTRIDRVAGGWRVVGVNR